MNLPISLSTGRLLIENITLNDNEFIFELLNSEGWLKFIGNRNVASGEEAKAYIQKIIDNPNVHYWIVKLKSGQAAIGIITFIKRDYLEFHDIGFAFLPVFSKKGYAYEATQTVLDNVIQTNDTTNILATTLSGNIPSIKLLQKLGFSYQSDIQHDNVKLCLYGISADKV